VTVARASEVYGIARSTIKKYCAIRIEFLKLGGAFGGAHKQHLCDEDEVAALVETLRAKGRVK
jgi:hypothetical protein